MNALGLLRWLHYRKLVLMSADYQSSAYRVNLGRVHEAAGQVHVALVAQGVGDTLLEALSRCLDDFCRRTGEPYLRCARCTQPLAACGCLGGAALN